MLSYTVITVQTHVAIVQFCINKYTTYALQMLLKQLLPIDIFFLQISELTELFCIVYNHSAVDAP